MTTIAANRDLLLIAADSAQLLDTRRELSPSKLYRHREFILGLAGDNGASARFHKWLRDGRVGKRPKGDYEAILLYRSGRLTVFTDCSPDEEEIAEPYYAIGSGEDFALAALDTLAHLKQVADPRTAIEVACRRDSGSAPPVHFLRWRKT